MNHTEDHSNRRRRGWLVAPLLFMVALCANAQTNTPKGAQVKTQKSAQLIAKKEAKKTLLLLAQNDAKKTPQLLAQADPPQTVPPSRPQAKRPVLSEVVITGSRIARAANDTLQPTVV